MIEGQSEKEMQYCMNEKGTAAHIVCGHTTFCGTPHTHVRAPNKTRICGWCKKNALAEGIKVPAHV